VEVSPRFSRAINSESNGQSFKTVSMIAGDSSRDPSSITSNFFGRTV
jgi:hypothetical protein